jgi:hypothetical protein
MKKSARISKIITCFCLLGFGITILCFQVDFFQYIITRYDSFLLEIKASQTLSSLHGFLDCPAFKSFAYTPIILASLLFIQCFLLALNFKVAANIFNEIFFLLNVFLHFPYSNMNNLKPQQFKLLVFGVAFTSVVRMILGSYDPLTKKIKRDLTHGEIQDNPQEFRRATTRRKPGKRKTTTKSAPTLEELRGINTSHIFMLFSNCEGRFRFYKAILWRIREEVGMGWKSVATFLWRNE